MADGYGRIAEKPAATLLHLGPGLANGIANLHNARRAATPIVNIVGDHARAHSRFDSPLASDIAALARPFSGWLHTSRDAATLAADGARAVAAARHAPGQIATLIVPADCNWNDAQGVAPALPITSPAAVSAATVDQVAQQIGSGPRAALLLRGAALTGAGLKAAGRIAAATGCQLLCDTFTPRLERGAGRVPLERIPYRIGDMVPFFTSLERLILVGASPPVASFGDPGDPDGCLPHDARVLYLAHPHEDGPQALEDLAQALNAPSEPAILASFDRPDDPTGALDQFAIGRAIARYLPEGAIIADESGSSKAGTATATATAAPHMHLSTTGGAIGQGLPVGSGAAMAAPASKVVCLQADGSALYTLQALWTQARERLDVTTVLLANRSYGVLRAELTLLGETDPGPRARSMLTLTEPSLDWVKLAKGFGVEASRAETAAAFADQFADAMRRPGPRLIEAVI
jgi:acetolactate synthase-1/2/3 large subunit